eukprot:7344101-Karenia_brevis.AAC.1
MVRPKVAETHGGGYFGIGGMHGGAYMLAEPLGGGCFQNLEMLRMANSQLKARGWTRDVQ